MFDGLAVGHAAVPEIHPRPHGGGTDNLHAVQSPQSLRPGNLMQAEPKRTLKPGIFRDAGLLAFGLLQINETDRSEPRPRLEQVSPERSATKPPKGRVAKPADASDLKSEGQQAPYEFKSRLGH